MPFGGLYGLVLVEATVTGFHYYRTVTLIYTRDAGTGQVPAELQLPGAVFQPYFGYTLRQGRDGPYLDEGHWVANNLGFQTKDCRSPINFKELCSLQHAKLVTFRRLISGNA